MKPSVENSTSAEKSETNESKEKAAKILKAFIAVSAGAIHVAKRISKAMYILPGGGWDEKEYSEYEEKGFIGMAAERAKKVYSSMDGIEDAGLFQVDEKTGEVLVDWKNADWEKILGGSQQKEEKTEK